MTCSSRNEINQEFAVLKEEIFRKVNRKKMSCNKQLKSNISKEIKTISKSSDEF